MNPARGFAEQDAVARLSATEWADDAPGIRVRETQLGGRRWAIVEYAAGAARADWCRDGHVGHVLSGRVEYVFEDGGPPLIVTEGDGFTLATGRGHRGANPGPGASRLFVIDDPAP